MPYVFLFSVANFVARLQNYMKLDKSSISLQTQYWLWFMFRGWSSSSTGTSGSRRRCSRTSRTTWRWTPTSRARIPGSGLNSGLCLDQEDNKITTENIFCAFVPIYLIYVQLLYLYIQLAMSYMNWKFWWTFSLNLKHLFPAINIPLMKTEWLFCQVHATPQTEGDEDGGQCLLERERTPGGWKILSRESRDIVNGWVTGLEF